MLLCRMNRTARMAATVLVLALPALAQQAAPAAKTAAKSAPEAQTVSLALVKPDSVGFDAARLDRLHTLMQAAVDHHQVNGVVTLLARHGKVVDYKAYGWQDIDAKKPMALDTLFRDYSMTKPVTAVAMLHYEN